MDLPPSVQRVIDRGVRDLNPERIVIFGSRGRGDSHPTSDFDIAFFGVENISAWPHFAADMIYEPPTLYHLDVMRYEMIPPEMQASVDEDGKVVYQRD